MKKPFFFSAKFIFISFILSALLFAGFFYGLSPKINSKYDASIDAAPSITKFTPTRAKETKDLFTKFGPAAGIAFGIIFLLLSFLLFGFFALVRLGKLNFIAPLIQLVVSAVIFVFSYNLAFDSAHSTALSSAIVYFIGYPLFYSFAVLSIIFLILILFSFIPRKKAPEMTKLTILLICLSTLLSGCDVLSGTLTMGCGFLDDSAHCYQENAIATNDPGKCEKVPKKKELKDLDSNPPKDKCYYEVAENKKDPVVCKNIKGGVMSYTVDECVESIVSSTETEIKTKLDQEKKMSPEELTAMQAQMDKNQKVLEMASNMSKNLHDLNQGIIRGLRQ